MVAIVDAVVHAFRDAGWDGPSAVRTFYAIFNYTLGFALVSAQSPPTDGPRPAGVFEGIDREAVPFALDVAPFLAQFVGSGMARSDEQFGFGLDLILDSVEERLSIRKE